MINKMTNYVIKNVLNHIWQFPQHILALILIKFMKSKYKEDYKGAKVYNASIPISGLSLGQYIFVKEYTTKRLIKHEYGHTRQSYMLGPLYLIIVGLPSITMNILSRLDVLDSERYYDRWPENWADKLGEVER